MKKSRIFLLPLIAFLSSCESHYASVGEKLYSTSKNGPNLVVPAAKSKANISNFYVLPAQKKNIEISILPPDKMAHQANKQG